MKTTKYYAIVSNRSYPIKLQDIREIIVTSTSFTKAFHKLEKRYKKVLIVERDLEKLEVE